MSDKKKPIARFIEEGRASFAFKCVDSNICKKRSFSFDDYKKNIKIIEVIKEMFEKHLKGKCHRKKGNDRTECVDSIEDVVSGFFESKGEYGESSSLSGVKLELHQYLEEYHKNIKREYRQYVKKISTYIKTNGLGAALAFFAAKGGTYDIILYQIGHWLVVRGLLRDFNDKREILKQIVELDSVKYRTITVEVLAFANWLRRFAEGLIEDEGGGE